MKELKLFDEQKIKKLKKAAAVGAMFVTLGCGVAQAMPVGGSIEIGSVAVNGVTVEGNRIEGEIEGISTGETIYDPQTATLSVVNGPAVVNWDSFQVGSSSLEHLIINTENGAMLNRVNGEVHVYVTDSSRFSKLEQIGANPCWIVSEEGITNYNDVGRGVITGQNLVLSSINISTQDFLAVVEGAKSYKVVGTPKTSAGSGWPIGVSLENLPGGPSTPSFVQIADGIVLEPPLTGGAFDFTDIVRPQPGPQGISAAMQQAVNQQVEIVGNILSTGSDSASGQGAGPAAMEGNGQAGAAAPAANPASVESLMQSSMGGIGNIENGQFTLGEAKNPDDGVEYVGVGDVTGAVTMNLWDNSSGAADGKAAEGTGAASGNNSEKTAR